MSESNLPVDSGTAADTSVTFSQGVEDITDLLSDSDAPNLEEEDQVQENAAEEPTEEAPQEAAEDGEEAEDAAQDDPVVEQEDDGSETVAAGGKFVSKDAKVRLEDGTVITVGELARNNLFQRDYTQKTTELKAERTQVEEAKKTVHEFAQTVAQQRDFLLRASKQLLPQPPDRSMMETDPLGYLQAKAAYDEQMQTAQQLMAAQQQDMQRQKEEQTRHEQEIRQRETNELLKAMPELKTPANYQKFWGEALETMAEYGFSEEELNATLDHRMYLAMRDLTRLRKARAKAPQVKQDIQKKPVLTGQKRMDPKAKTSRDKDATANRLRQTGSFEDGVAALMNLDL